MTQAEQLAAFASRASYDRLSGKARDELKIRLIDSLGCAIGALAAEPVRIIREQIHEFNGSGLCTCIGGGRRFPEVRRRLLQPDAAPDLTGQIERLGELHAKGLL